MHQRIVSHAEEFRLVFGVSLDKFYPKYSYVFGFDIVGFDAWMQDQKPFDEDVYSLRQITEQRYGTRGLAIIEDMLQALVGSVTPDQVLKAVIEGVK